MDDDFVTLLTVLLRSIAVVSISVLGSLLILYFNILITNSACTFDLQYSVEEYTCWIENVPLISVKSLKKASHITNGRLKHDAISSITLIASSIIF